MKTVTIDAPPDTCWAVIADVDRWPEWTGGLDRATIIERDDHGRATVCETVNDAKVKKVTVRLAPSVANVVDNRDIPDICLQHMVAVMLIDKTVSFQAAHDKPCMQDAAVLKQRAKVNLVRDEELAKLLPARETVVEIDLNDGAHLSERVSAVRGTPRNPMGRNEVIDKVRDLTAPVLGRDPSTKLIETIFEIEKVADIRTLRRMFQRG